MSDEANDVKRNEKAPADASEDAALLLDEDRSFFGSHTHTVDNKGRLVIPQDFREILGSPFCIAPSYDFKSISIYPTKTWEELKKKYTKMGSMNPVVNLYKEQYFALSYKEQECDGQGRVLLPAELRELILKNEHDVKITGAGDHIRVADASGEKQRWDDFIKALPSILDVIGSLERNDG